MENDINNLADSLIMKVQAIVNEACENIVSIITSGKLSVNQEDRVLLVGDTRDLSPIYTRTLRNAIIKRMGTRSKSRVLDLYFPSERPMKKIPPIITKYIKGWATVVVGTYSNPGNEITNAEEKELSEGYRRPIFDNNREKGGNIKLYVVASRPTLKIHKLLSEDFKKIDALSIKVKRFLDKNKGKEVLIKTNGYELRFNIPKELKVKASLHSAESFIMNIPEGETYFQPERGTANGELCMRKGSAYQLAQKISGKIIMKFKNGKIESVEDIFGKDKNIVDRIEKQLDEDSNTRNLAECGIGTNLFSKDLPMKDKLYNRLILEKQYGYHIAYGSSDQFGKEYGNIKAKYHMDNLFQYGDVIIDNKKLIDNGKINTKIL